jgi:hypothetical protein
MYLFHISLARFQVLSHAVRLKPSALFSICESDREGAPEDPPAGGNGRPGIWETNVTDVKTGRFGGLSFTAPPFKDPSITEPVFCTLYIERPR